MKVLFLLLLLVTPLCAQINEEVLLDSIAIVETGNRDLVGAAGERGVYQLTPAVAKRVGGYNRRAAHRWVLIIMRDLRVRGVDVSVYNVGLAYNGGINGLMRSRLANSTYDYAARLTVVYSTRLPVVAVPTPLPPKPLRFNLTPPMFTLPQHP